MTNTPDNDRHERALEKAHTAYWDYSSDPEGERDMAKAIAAYLSEMDAVIVPREQWQPIETAPVGQDILLYFPAEPKRYLGEMVTVGRYPVHIPRQPSHWHRVPPKPHHFNQEGK